MNDYARAPNQSLLTTSSPTFAGLTINGAATFAATVTATGQFLAGNGSEAAPSYSFVNDPDSGFFAHAANIVGLSLGGTARYVFASTQIVPLATGVIEIGASANRFPVIYLGGNTPAASAPMIDCSQTWNDAGVTFTGAKIAVTNTASGGSSRVFEVFAGAAGATSVFSVDPSGNIRCPGALIGNDNIFAGQTAYIQWSGRSFMFSPDDGVILFQDSATTSFGRLCFGGTTSSFPAIKRNGSGVQVRLADDSGYGGFSAYDIQMFGNALYDASSNKVVGAQGAAVADATGAGDIVAQFNTLLARLRATGGHGLIAD